MSTGLVRAAFCSILTETVDLSDRNTKARDSIRVFLDQITEESALKRFDEFAASLSSEIELSVSSCVSAASFEGEIVAFFSSDRSFGISFMML